MPKLKKSILIGLAVLVILLLVVLSTYFFFGKQYAPALPGEDTTTFSMDENREMKITLSDSINNQGIEEIQYQIKNYIENADRFNIDTVSTLSAASLALEGKARDLQKKLMMVLPKVSITTGKGEDRLTREYYIIEGDIKVDRDELHYYCLKRLQNRDTGITHKIESRKLTIVTDKSGNPSIWPVGIEIQYCIMRSSFASKSFYDSVVKSMRDAVNDWMQACNIRFRYVPELDKKEVDIESYQGNVLFIVRQMNVNGDFTAQSFFPADPTYKRLLLVDNSFFTSPFSKTGVLRHELGHILGFRHEHIWSEDASCSGESIIEDGYSARAKTKYDPFSVMHYPCGQNKENRVIELTNFDKEGARKIYPFNKL